MIYRRERPICRRALMSLCKEYDYSLQELLDHSSIFLSKNLRIQAHKMIDESCFHTDRELRDFEDKIRLHRFVGLIK